MGDVVMMKLARKPTKRSDRAKEQFLMDLGYVVGMLEAYNHDIEGKYFAKFAAAWDSKSVADFNRYSRENHGWTQRVSKETRRRESASVAGYHVVLSVWQAGRDKRQPEGQKE